MACALWGACGCARSGAGDERSGDSATKPRALRIGYQKSSALLNLLRSRRTLEKRFGSDVTVVWQEFVAGPQLLEALNIGSIDFGTTGEAPPIFAQAAGAPLVYVAMERVGPTTEALLVRRDAPYRTLADLKGKRIALNKASNVHYFLVRALEDAGLKYSDVDPVFLTPADGRAAFEGGRVDAWMIWDPFYTAAVESGEARLLLDGTGLVQNYSYFLSTRTFVTQQTETLEALLDELRAMSDWARDHREEVAAFLADYLQMDVDVLRIAERRREYEVEHIDSEAVAYQQRVADAFFKLRLLPQNVNIAEALWTPQ